MGGQVRCVNKSQFFSEQVAEIRAADLNLEFGYERFRAYKCNCCNHYHLTTQK